MNTTITITEVTGRQLAQKVWQQVCNWSDGRYIVDVTAVRGQDVDLVYAVTLSQQEIRAKRIKKAEIEAVKTFIDGMVWMWKSCI